MELSLGTPKASNSESQDFISNLPENVVANILDRLPLQYTVRTSILSRNWRYKWTLLSQLVCDKNFSNYLSKNEENKSLLRIIVVLLHYLKGPITKFVVSYKFENVEDIIECVLCLSKKGIKDLTIEDPPVRFLFGAQPHTAQPHMSPFFGAQPHTAQPHTAQPLKLPIHLYSCLELKHLKLESCCFNPLTSFHGFPNLLSLELCEVQFASGKFWELCPSLETLKMASPFQTSKVKPAEIGKLVNLKILSLFMCNLDNTSSSSIFELLGFLPKLQELHLDLINCMFTEDCAENSFPSTTFLCIKTLKLSTIDLGNSIMLTFAFKLINSFPNLQNLEITGSERAPGICFSEGDYNTTGSLQLWSLVFRDLKGTENEVSLIKYLVTCSPFLKKVVIHPDSILAPLTFAGKLLKLQRAYPVLDINLY